MKPHVVISSSQKTLRVPRKRIAELAELAARAEGVRLSELDVAVVGDADMAAHNRRWMRHAGVTDVISFDLSSGERRGLCIQLIVCGPEAVRQARLHGETPTRELLRYVAHGLLHQMGYEDQSIRGAAKMHAREDELLAALRKAPMKQ